MKIYEYRRVSFTKEFFEFLSKELSEDLMPYYTEYGAYRFDWSIIGGHLARLLFEPYYKQTLECLNKLSVKDREWLIQWGEELSIESQKTVLNWLRWISVNIFEIEKMTFDSIKTSRVLLRIAVSKLNNLDIDRKYKDYLFDNLIYSFYSRRRALDEYYFKYILELPF